VLFSSDIFGGLEESWDFYAKEDYFEQAKAFHSAYMPSKDIFNYALRKIEQLDINLIAPQHGSIIERRFVYRLIEDMKNLECGLFVKKKYNDELIDTIARLEQKERELEEKNRLMDTLLNITIEGVFIVDEDRNFTVANQPALDMLQLSAEELSSYNMSDFVPPQERQKVEEAKKKEYVPAYEIDVYRKDKTIFPALIQGSDFFINNKKYRIGTIIDLT